MKASPKQKYLIAKPAIQGFIRGLAPEPSLNLNNMLHHNTPSPVSDNHLPPLNETSLMQGGDQLKSHNTSLDKDASIDDSSKLGVLPTINNPKAEKRLKALFSLLKRKNPKAKISSEKRRKHKADSIEEISTEKLNLAPFPSLPSLTPRPAEKGDIEDVRKFVIRSPGNKGSGEKSRPNRARRIFPKYLKPLEAGESGDKYRAYNRSEERSKSGIPDVTMNFDCRVHKVTIDDAIERLEQLTKQSNHARKDLLKIQENALAIRLSYERNHRSLSKINSTNDGRNH